MRMPIGYHRSPAPAIWAESLFERLGRREVEHKFVSRRQLDRQVSRPFALQDTADINALATIGVKYAGALTHETASLDELAEVIASIVRGT
jgi:hypothetical protein